MWIQHFETTKCLKYLQSALISTVTEENETTTRLTTDVDPSVPYIPTKLNLGILDNWKAHNEGGNPKSPGASQSRIGIVFYTQAVIIMASAAMKIRKAKGGEADDFEMSIAQEIYNLQVSSDMKADLHALHIAAAKEVELAGGRKAIIIFVPFKQLRDYHKIQTRLIRELEKKFR